MTIARLARCQRGASALEFALLAPLFFAFLFGLIEVGRLLWVSQSINEIAFSTVRCMSTSSSCATTPTIQAYAVQRAASYSLTVVGANVVTASNVACDGNANSNRVTITYVVNSITGNLLPLLPSTLVAHSCFPKLS